MKKWKFLSPPVFSEDENKSSRAATLHQVQILLLILSVVFLPIASLIGSFKEVIWVINLSLIGATTLSYFLNQRGQLTAASYLIVTITIAALIFVDYIGRGQSRPLLMLSIIPIFISGLLVGFRAIISTAVVLSIAHTIFVYMDMQDWYPFPGTEISTVQSIAVPAIGFITSAGLLQLTLRRVQTLYERAKVNEQKARQSNALLAEAQQNLQQYVAQLESATRTLQEKSESLTHQTQELERANQTNRRRALEFQAIAEISQAITELNDLSELLPRITQTISAKLKHYHTGIFLLDQAQEYAVLVASNSEGGKHMLQRGHRLQVGKQGVVGYVAATGSPRVALDVGQDAVYFDNPDLPDTHSEIALPLIHEERVIGVLDVQSTEPNAFDAQDIEILSTLASQVSAAIQNARRFQETQKALLEAQSLYRQLIQRDWARLSRKQNLTGFRYDQVSILPAEPVDPETAQRAATEKVILETGEQTTRLVVPITLRGETIGVFEAQANKNRAWRQDEIDILNAIADRVALAAENARLFEQTVERAERERKVSEITSKIRATNNPNEMIQIAINELKQTLPIKDVRILPYKPAQDEKG